MALLRQNTLSQKLSREIKKIPYLMIKESIHQEEIYAPNKSTQVCEANIYTTEGRNSNTVIVGDFSTALSIMDSSRQNINEETEDLNSIIDQRELSDI